MEKKIYETPEIEVVELEKQAPLLVNTPFNPDGVPGHDDVFG